MWHLVQDPSAGICWGHAVQRTCAGQVRQRGCSQQGGPRAAAAACGWCAEWRHTVRRQCWQRRGRRWLGGRQPLCHRCSPKPAGRVSSGVSGGVPRLELCSLRPNWVAAAAAAPGPLPSCWSTVGVRASPSSASSRCAASAIAEDIRRSRVPGSSSCRGADMQHIAKQVSVGLETYSSKAVMAA